MEVVCTEASPAGMQTTGKRIMAGTWFDEISRASQAEQVSNHRKEFHQTMYKPLVSSILCTFFLKGANATESGSS